MIIQYLVYQGKKSIKSQEKEMALYIANYIKSFGKVYSIQEASKKLKETPDRIKLLMKRGIMPFIQINDEVFITKKVIAQFLAIKKRMKVKVEENSPVNFEPLKTDEIPHDL